MLQSTGTASTYEEVRDRVKGLVCNRLAVNSGPAPMDLGFVQEQEHRPHTEDDSWMLGVVGTGTMCNTCGDDGRCARDCPYFPPTSCLGTDKRKGHGKAKGDGKGGSTLFNAQPSRREEERAAKAKEKAPARTDSVDSATAAANVATDSVSAPSGPRPLRVWKRKSSSWEAC